MSVPNVSLAWNVPQYQVEHIQSVIIETAEKYNVDKAVMFAIVESESSYNCKKAGDYGTSFGCVQIHLPDHPNVSRKQAENIYFAINFLAKNLALGKCSMWSTCPLVDI